VPKQGSGIGRDPATRAATNWSLASGGLGRRSASPSELAGEGLLSAAHSRGTFVRPRPDRRTINIGGPDHPDLFDDQSVAERHGRTRTEHPHAARYRQHNSAVTGSYITPATRDHLIGLPGGPDQPTQSTPHASTRPEPSKDVEPPDNTDEPEYEPREQDYGTTLYKILTTQHGPVSFTASVTARMPRGDELDELGTPVLQVRRAMTNTHGRPLETILGEAAADRFAAADTTTGDQNAIMAL
jgi:GntR family transcriptional regulator